MKASNDNSSDFVATHVEELSHRVEHWAASSDDTLFEGVVATKLAPLVRKAPEAVVRLALLNDCLLVGEQAMMADGRISELEVAYLEPLVRAAGPFFAQLRQSYTDLVKGDAGDFLGIHRSDKMLFGGACQTTEWLGLDLCQRVARKSGQPDLLHLYELTLGRLLDEVVAIEGITTEEAGAREALRELIHRWSRVQDTEPGVDRRAQAFCDPNGPEVFHAVAHGNQVFDQDPFDVETIHEDARDAFARLVVRAAGGMESTGKVLLIKGESGSGKTHLMRAFRTHVHGRGLGACGYMQMSSKSDDYGRYALVALLESFDRPHSPPGTADSTLMCLSDALVHLLPASQSVLLIEGELSHEELGFETNRLADLLLRQPELDGFEPDFLRALLYLQRRDPPLKARVIKYLRCEELSSYDRQLLGEITPWARDEDAIRMIRQLGLLMERTRFGALVLLIDQLEDLYNVQGAKERFRRAMDVVRHVAELVPSSVIVIACLEQLYTTFREYVAKPILDRLEKDPEPFLLRGSRSLGEVEELVARRVAHLYDALDVPVRDEEPLYPFTRSQLEALATLRTRDVLDGCRRFRQRCIETGTLDRTDLEPAGVGPTSAAEGEAAQATIQALSQAWNDYRSEGSAEPPTDDKPLAELLSWAVVEAVKEAGLAEGVATRTVEERFVEVKAGKSKPALVGITNKAPRGGGLDRQLREHEQAAGDASVVLVRSSEWPTPRNPGAAYAVRVGKILSAGGSRVVMGDSEWRALSAFRSFADARAGDPGFDVWRRDEKPIAQLDGLRAIVGPLLEAAKVPSEAPPPTVKEAPTAAAPATKPQPAATLPNPAGAPARFGAPGELAIGQTRGLSPRVISVAPQSLVMHSAFLGTTGSGKTTLALNLVEQMLLQGVPAILLDRKGDLAKYADLGSWAEPLTDPVREQRRQALRAKVRVDLFTPGDALGRPLFIPLVPEGVAELPMHEHRQVAGYAASALGSMMGLKATGQRDAKLRVILQKAIEVLTMTGAVSVGLESLVDLLDREDDLLVNAVGKLDTKDFRRLVEALETLRLSKGHLFATDGERLAPGQLLRADGGRTPLTIISTKGLPDIEAQLFWVARFLVTLTRWASANPSKKLQALVLLDEADMYLPATSKPATKEPLNDLLRRARSAGIGVMLATQNPGDLDYKGRDNIRTWFVGRVTANTAIEKMKGLLSNAKINVSGRLANAGIGEFFRLAEGQVEELKASRNVVETDQLPEDQIRALARETAK